MDNRGFVLAVVLVLTATFIASTFYSGPTGNTLFQKNPYSGELTRLGPGESPSSYSPLIGKNKKLGDGEPPQTKFCSTCYPADTPGTPYPGQGEDKIIVTPSCTIPATSSCEDVTCNIEVWDKEDYENKQKGVAGLTYEWTVYGRCGN